jgi:hypothetical protein
VYYWKLSNISEVLEKRKSKVVDEGHLLRSLLKDAPNYIHYIVPMLLQLEYMHIVALDGVEFVFLELQH